MPNLSSITTDLDSNPRIYNGRVDLGAYEYQHSRLLDTLIFGADSVICYGDTAKTSFHFTGIPPWRLIYTKDRGMTYDTIKSISDSLFRWGISPLQTTTYMFVSVGDNNCVLTIMDSMQVVVHPITEIASTTDNTQFLCEGDELKIEVSATGKDIVYQWYKDSNVLYGEQDSNFIISVVSPSHDGVYYADIKGVCGDVRSKNIIVDVNTIDKLVEKWHDVILVDNSTSEYIGYQWYKDGAIIHGATQQFYQEIGGLNGCYSADLLLKNGGTVRSCQHCAYKTEKSEGIRVHPNPTAGKLQITNYELRDDERIEIYDVVGQKLLNYQLIDNLIDISHLSAGLYFLKIGNKMVKIIKE
jgi:hypothetical protein